VLYKIKRRCSDLERRIRLLNDLRGFNQHCDTLFTYQLHLLIKHACEASIGAAISARPLRASTLACLAVFSISGPAGALARELTDAVSCNFHRCRRLRSGPVSARCRDVAPVHHVSPQPIADADNSGPTRTLRDGDAAAPRPSARAVIVPIACQGRLTQAAYQ
jgi:hypothetical protein